MDLLEKAKNYDEKPRKKGEYGLNITSEHLQLAKAYLRGNISLMGASEALGVTNHTQTYITLLRAIKRACELKKIEI